MSYDVTTMWNGVSSLYVTTFLYHDFRRIFRSSAVPQYGTALRRGTKRTSSCCQLCTVDAGAMTRNGPQIPWCSARYASREMDWMV
jgi:hypothetical protein